MDIGLYVVEQEIAGQGRFGGAANATVGQKKMSWPPAFVEAIAQVVDVVILSWPDRYLVGGLCATEQKIVRDGLGGTVSVSAGQKRMS